MYSRLIELVVGIIAGLLLCMSFCGGFHTCSKAYNKFIIGGIMIHAHHWLLSMISIVLLSFIPCLRDSGVLLGALVGCMIHGFVYHNWYIVMKPK